MSRQCKQAAVLRLLRGENLKTVARALGITAATLSGWRDAFLAAGKASLVTRSTASEALESQRLKGRPPDLLKLKIGPLADYGCYDHLRG